MMLIVYRLHEHKLEADSRVTSWPSTATHQCLTPAALSRGYLQVSMSPDTPLSTNVIHLRSMSLRFQVGFRLHQQPFRILIFVWLLPLLSMKKLSHSQSQSYRPMYQWVLPSLDSTNLQTILSILKKISSHPLA